jgi:hypothetical protein
MIMIFIKGFFLKLDSHNIKNLTSKIDIDKEITYKKGKEYIYNLKNKFRIY